MFTDALSKGPQLGTLMLQLCCTWGGQAARLSPLRRPLLRGLQAWAASAGTSVLFALNKWKARFICVEVALAMCVPCHHKGATTINEENQPQRGSGVMESSALQRTWWGGPGPRPRPPALALSRRQLFLRVIQSDTSNSSAQLLSFSRRRMWFHCTFSKLLFLCLVSASEDIWTPLARKSRLCFTWRTWEFFRAQ